MGRGGREREPQGRARRRVTAAELMAGAVVPGRHADAPEPEGESDPEQEKRRTAKVYRCSGFGEPCIVHPQDGDPYYLDHFVRHSPAGFAWGYDGSGAAELARCILIDYLGCDEEVKAGRELPVDYQRFKAEVIARQPQGRPFELASEDIEAWLGRAGR